MIRPHPRGATVLEATAALVLVAALLCAVAQLALLINNGRRTADDRRTALREAENQLERLAAAPFAELTPDGAARIGISPEAAGRLPHAMLSVRIDEIDDVLPARRLVVTVNWSGATPEIRKEVTVVGFRFDGGGEPMP